MTERKWSGTVRVRVDGGKVIAKVQVSDDGLLKMDLGVSPNPRGGFMRRILVKPWEGVGVKVDKQGQSS
ncbi:hypothetical protein A2686_01930 [Candidatus Woesebacteria bacterium RIFCSPHIGHO2_01_FULL_38_10]|uniref:Uncharacterized protein n=1 Tax=Candidatus Woesebacteria bacterium RIFCSPLOWO2_01_FULL_39_10b TaxID=1802517 RepID=A0A1F8BBL4_9BACT|nr:MAG: hypothetical protein A2686_01930 [Candidatus Woesebacteria bacterium RIFCSPHIGHO2_01_FULL_38_10]OGM60738.1 MAG: hypothetical protein A2892_01700 [Candidatus Woesebacteria bacterium RIFCSPLOWO2_01_FULL_39_10b]